MRRKGWVAAALRANAAAADRFVCSIGAMSWLVEVDADKASVTETPLRQGLRVVTTIEGVMRDKFSHERVRIPKYVLYAGTQRRRQRHVDKLAADQPHKRRLSGLQRKERPMPPFDGCAASSGG